MITDEELDVLGDYFEEAKLLNKGWQFHEFVDEYLAGHIYYFIPNSKSKLVNEFTSLQKNIWKRFHIWL